MADNNCRFCASPLRQSFCDLGLSPLSNAYVPPGKLQRMEPFYPLHAYVCSHCQLVQLQEFESPEQIFSDYAYFSSYSESWLQHARQYAETITAQLQLNEQHQVIEIASNDGYLLQYFQARGVTSLGIEPAKNVAAAAQAAGIPTRVAFFGRQLAGELVSEGLQADLLLGNNVLAHVPDLNDFVAGLKVLLKADGMLTMEFPHLLQLIEKTQFDTIYHEHFSYFSLLTAVKIFAWHGLAIVDVEELPTHGGSLRIYVRHTERNDPPSERFHALLQRERHAGLEHMPVYQEFTEQVRKAKRQLLAFLIEQKAAGRQIVGYGAPAKGNTLLNYCGIRSDFIDYTVDLSPHKQGLYLPGTHIPIYAPERINETRPDYVLVLPWNLKDEIMGQLAHVRDWGGRFVVPIPQVEIL